MALLRLRQFLLCGRVVRVAGVMAEQQFRFIIDTVAVAVLLGNDLQPRRDVLSFTSLRQLFPDHAQALPKRIVGELVDTFRVLVFAWPMASRAARQVLGEKFVIMPFERRFVGGSGLNRQSEQEKANGTNKDGHGRSSATQSVKS